MQGWLTRALIPSCHAFAGAGDPAEQHRRGGMGGLEDVEQPAAAAVLRCTGDHRCPADDTEGRGGLEAGQCQHAAEEEEVLVSGFAVAIVYRLPMRGWEATTPVIPRIHCW